MTPTFPQEPLRLPISAPLFLLLVVVIPITTHPSSYFASFEATWSCSDLQNIPYPICLLNDSDARPISPCPYEGFNLTCRNSSIILRFGSSNYTVTRIDLNSYTITVADADFDVVPSSNDCLRLRHNFTLDPELPLRWTPSDDNLTFFYNCTDGGGNLEEYSIPCLSSAGGGPSYVLTREALEYPDRIPRSCGRVVVAPVLKDSLLSHTHELPLMYGGLLRSGFQLSLPLVTSGDCVTCEKSGGRCGLNKTTDSNLVFACFCSDGIKATSHCGAGSAEKKGKRTMLVLGVVIALATSSLLCLFLVFYIRRSTESHKYPQKGKTHKNNRQSPESFLQGSLVPKRYKYAQVKRMTESFRYKLGQGGFGSVFKGTLPDGRLVAVKLLSEAKGNGEEFINEVASISKTSHVNIVALLGFCLEKSKRALIYDFMPNGSLEKFICSDESRTEAQFSCGKLYEIALGIARGLEYLHGGCNTRIIHFDIKPHNILLDQDFCPKISDFGLAKLCPPKESKISMAVARGTIGYIAPEVYSRSFGIVSTKSDVYSYGMMLLEMVGGRRKIDAENDNSSEAYFPHWLYDNVDRYCKEGITGITSEMEETMRKMIVIGLWCIQAMPEKRPSMRNVVEMLKGGVEELQMPPRP